MVKRVKKKIQHTEPLFYGHFICGFFVPTYQHCKMAIETTKKLPVLHISTFLYRPFDFTVCNRKLRIVITSEQKANI